MSSTSDAADLQLRGWVKVVIALLVCGLVFGVVSRFSSMLPPAATIASAQSPTPDVPTVAVTAPLGGQVLRVTVAEGDRVSAGQVIAELDPRPLEQQAALAKARLALAEAELQREEAVVARLRVDLPLQTTTAEQTLAVAKAVKAKADETLKQTMAEVESGLAEAKAAADAARTVRDFAKKEQDRFAVLPPDEAATLRRSQEASRAYALAVVNLAQAEAKVASAEAASGRVAVAQASVKEAESAEMLAATALERAQAAEKAGLAMAELEVAAKTLAVDAAKQTLALADSARNATTVRAPAAGTVHRIERRPTDTVAAGTVLLALRIDSSGK